MQDMVEKTIASLPGLVASTLGLGSGTGATPGRGGEPSRGFQSFVRNISNAKSKHEEDQLLLREITLQKKKLAHRDQTNAQKRESLVRLLYCHMLGKDVSFASIDAIKLTQQGSIIEKRVGYLVCSLLMSDGHELVMLLVNTILRDLQSTNILENLAGMTAVVHLCSTEMVPALLPLVKDKLNHPKDIIRKKAVLCMHHFLHKAPEMVQNDLMILKRMLSDRDPSVVWATLHIFYELVQANPSDYRDLVPGLLSILGQVIGRKLPTEYDYHTVPSPWMTILILRILGKLGAQDQRSSQEIYPVLKDVLQKTEPSHKMGLAVIFECLQTITEIYPYPQLVDHAVSCVGRFLSAKNINLKYLGLKALVSMVTLSPSCTVEHQNVILDCLEHPDITIQRQSLELLYKMANGNNVTVISTKMLAFMTKTNDKFIKADIVHKVTQLTEKYSSDLLWYIQTMNLIIATADDNILPDTVTKILGIISQGCRAVGDESDPLADKQLRAAVFHVYWAELEQDNQAEMVIQVAVWVLGEYSHCVQDICPRQIISMLLKWYSTTSNEITKCHIVSALCKLAYYITDTEGLLHVLHNTAYNRCMELKQRIEELTGLCKGKQTLKIAANPETRPDITKLDFSLSFLDSFVCDALQQGAAPYRPRSIKMAQTQASKDIASSMSGSSLSFAPYQKPLVPSRGSGSSRGLEASLAASVSSGTSKEDRETGLKLKNNKKVWGREGIIKEESPAKVLPDNMKESEIETSPSQLEQFHQMTLTLDPEQQKRQELASALFGSIKSKSGSLDPMNTELISISHSESQNQPQRSHIHELSPLVDSNKMLESELKDEILSQSNVASSTTPPQNLSSDLNNSDSTNQLASDSQSVSKDQDKHWQTDLNRDHSTEDAVNLHNIGNLVSGLDEDSLEDFQTLITSSSSANHLLNHTSIMSPDEQVLPGGIFNTFGMVDVDDMMIKDITSNGSNTLAEQNSGNVPYNKSDSNCDNCDNDIDVSANGSNSVLKTMYDDFTSSQSSSSDDFVRPMHLTDTNVADSNSVQKSISEASKLALTSKLPGKDLHPSPWKMIGARKSSNNCDESTEDSISIEVDSIEDEDPPSEFIVENPSHVLIESNPSDIAICDIIKSLHELESLPKSEPMVLMNIGELVVKCQKVFRKDCLVLAVDINNAESERETKLDATEGTISLLCQENYHTVLLPVFNEVYPLPHSTTNTSTHPIPGTVLVMLKPKHKPITRPVDLELVLNGQSCTCQMEVELADFLRPSDIGIDEYGRLWSCDQMTLHKTSTPVSNDAGQTDSRGHIETLQDLGFGLIQNIGTEDILSTRWLEDTEVILLHCQTAKDVVYISVKGQHMHFVHQVVSMIEDHFLHDR